MTSGTGRSSVVRMILGTVTALATVPLTGCVIAVGNDMGGEGYQWRDDDERPRMGVTLGPVDKPLASQLSIDADEATLILGVISGMPAEKAGVKVHDVVVAIDGVQGARPDQLRRAIRATEPGAELKLSIIRAGHPVELTVVLDERPTPQEP